jgi:alkylation response protein AidB-like acyl-CoA dehydrogenase
VGQAVCVSTAEPVDLGDLREVVRDFLAARSPSSAVRTAMDSGYDHGLWRELAADLGLAAIAVPEEFGGAGAGMAELTVVFEEMGAALLCAPYFATVALAIPTLLGSADAAAAREYLPSLVDGARTATVIFNGTLDAFDPAAVTLTARSGPDYRLYGAADRVIDGYTANTVLAVANTDVGTTLFAVDTDASDAAGLTREPLATLDRTRKVARLNFDGVSARRIGVDGGAAPGLQRAYHLAVVALAAEQLGAAQRCLDMAVNYAKERIQFGRAIGSFQAVKHRCADMLVAVEGARSAVQHAAGLPDGEDLAVAASVAKMACSEAFLQVALDNMRVHGGIGFTWEHDAHLYVRRAKTTQLIFGTPDHHAQALATLVASSGHQPEGPP